MCEEGTDKRKKQKEKSQEETVKMVEVDFKEIKKLDEVLKEVVEEKVKERGYFFILSDKDDSTTLVISAGEKPTEGYEVKVTNAIQEGDILTVIVEEIEPSDDEIVTDKISYPYTVVKLENTDAKEFYVIDVEGKEFFNIEKETKEVKAEGIFNGTIGNDSIEILLDGKKSQEYLIQKN